MRSVDRRLAVTFVIASITILLAAPALAQGTIADYQRAMGLRERYSGLAVDVAGNPDWISESSRFWYRTSVTGGDVFVLVDAATREQRAAFDHDRLADALSAALDDDTITGINLPFSTIEFVDDESAIEVPIDETVWRCDLSAYTCEDTGRPVRRGRGGFGASGGGANDQPRVSPDGRWEAFIDNYNVAVREVRDEDQEEAELIHLSLDGSEGNAYALRSIAWSPDSSKIAAYRVQPGYVREVHYVESSPDDQLQPKHFTREYTKPGDRLDVDMPVVFDVTTRTQHDIDNALFPNAYANSRLVWREDSSAVTFEYNQRGHQVYRVIEIDAADGSARAVIDEQMETFFDYSGKKFRHDVNDGEEIIWMSERDGWNHLYLYDGASGMVKNQITRGAWPVREVIDVDDANRQIYFIGSGMNDGEDPYFEHVYRIGFDGTGLIDYTPAAATHQVTFSPDKQYYVDRYSRVDLAPVAELRRTSDQSLVMELERGDISALTDTGWEAPEVFVAKGRDDVTDIWGVIFRPTGFDESRTYPVIEYIYAGPHDSFVPKAFQEYNSMREIAELGFIVVQIDGMGTSNRSKAFHDVAWMNLKDAGFPDRILWHQAVAARYPYYDITRVGIYGTSAGGQSSLGGMLFHPDFYDVAVSAAGCHDNRMDKIWWNEQWMGWPIGPHYAESSNVDNAWRLQGDVLLIVGELDTNVDPSSTLQVVDALIKADKPFDLLVIPGADHTSGGDYGQHKRMDYFVQHLLGVDPPEWADLEAAMTDDDVATQGRTGIASDLFPSWDDVLDGWLDDDWRR
jgi:dipeptidyl aminopeptidase/acylaminoacyl peptidase